MEQNILESLQATAQSLVDEISEQTKGNLGSSYEKVSGYMEVEGHEGKTIQLTVKAITDEDEFLEDDEIHIE